MFDYARRLQLALGDTARRSGMKVAAGALVVIGAGFLIASLWSWLATGLGLGPTIASLIVGGAFVFLGLIAFLLASKPRHRMPTSDDLRREVEARVNMAADAAVDRARAEAMRFAGMAEHKARSVMGNVGLRASSAERRAQDVARDAAERSGLTEENLRAAQERMDQAAAATSRAANSNAGSMAKLAGAFVIGLALASKLGSRREDPDRHTEL
ncbi:phage holin family protein [Paracoccus sp. Z330]|uniref:Phage holin family protein n=1 Tax=Paracoccus onchidii TaxID=3017813 RepID=A0ABT4ZII4_9RHOB|nr:phage holin family protein [Paracoccus onchidii]MDB6178545.1 phage holin family protein [Paracoccus onchidii]